MFVYSQRGGVTKTQHDVVDDFCNKHNDFSITDALVKEGYHHNVKVGEDDVACIELFFTQNQEAENKAIALVELAGNIETYVFETFHDALVFMKEFTPMIESILRVRALEGK
ncbi:hypothetical protein [Pseudomonas putida]